MARGSATVTVKVTGDVSRFQKAMDSGASTAKKFGKAAAVALKAAAAAAAVAGAALLKLGTDFDDAFDTIRVGTGATGAQLEGLQDDFRSLANSVPLESMKDGATAIADLNTRLGLTGRPLTRMAAQMTELARITGSEVAPLIRTTTRVFGDWAIATEDQEDALDALFRASQATGATVEELAAQAVTVGAPMRQLGFTFEQTVGIIGKFEKEGVNSQAVLQGMRQALGRMAKAGEEPIETFARLSEEIAEAGSVGESNAIAVEAFGTRAGPDLAAAVREGRFELGELLATVEGGSETIFKAAEDTRDWRQSLQLLRQKAFLALEPVATRVFDRVGEAAEGAIAVFEHVREAVEAGTDPWIALGEAIDAQFGTGGRASQAIETIREVVETTFSVVRTTFETIQSVVRTTTKIWEDHSGPIKAVAAVLAASYVPAAINATAAAVSYGVGTATAWASAQAAAIASAGKQVAAWAATRAANLKSLALMAATAVKVVAHWALMGAKSLLHAGRVAAAWLVALGPIGLVIAGVAGVAAAVVANWETIKRWVGKLVGWFQGLPDKISSAVSGLWDGLKESFRNAVNWIIRKWNDFELKIGGKTIDPPGPGPKIRIPSVTLATPDIPMLARGGFESGLALLGERGPELVDLGRGARVHSTEDTRRILSSGDTNVTIYTRSEASARDIADEITWSLRTGGAVA